MSRTHAFEPVDPADAPVRGPGQRATGSAASLCYVERAMLLWPRLDRTRLHRIAHDPERIAELVCQRTSQPYASILAMLTREEQAPAARTERSNGFESGSAGTSRIALRVMLRPARAEVDSIVEVPA